MKRLHNVVCFAIHPGHKDLQCTSICVLAEDLAGALEGRDEWWLAAHPPEDGWESHSVGAQLVPDELVMEGAQGAYLAMQGHKTQMSVGIACALSEPIVKGTMFEQPPDNHATKDELPPLFTGGQTIMPPVCVDLSDPNTAMPIP